MPKIQDLVVHNGGDGRQFQAPCPMRSLKYVLIFETFLGDRSGQGPSTGQLRSKVTLAVPVESEGFNVCQSPTGVLLGKTISFGRAATETFSLSIKKTVR